MFNPYERGLTLSYPLQQTYSETFGGKSQSSVGSENGKGDKPRVHPQMRALHRDWNFQLENKYSCVVGWHRQWAWKQLATLPHTNAYCRSCPSPAIDVSGMIHFSGVQDWCEELSREEESEYVNKIWSTFSLPWELLYTLHLKYPAKPQIHPVPPGSHLLMLKAIKNHYHRSLKAFRCLHNTTKFYWVSIIYQALC